MKFIGTVISGLMMALALATAGQSPIAELQRLLDNRRRIFNAFLAGVIGFLLLFSAFLMALVEAALQYEAQGFVFWSALFSLAAGLSAVGFISLFIAKAAMPRLLPTRLNFSAFEGWQTHLNELLQTWLRHNFQPSPAGGSPPVHGAPTAGSDREMPRPPPASGYPAGESTLSH